MQNLSKRDPIPHRDIKIISDIFEPDQSSSQLQIKHGQQDVFDSLFPKQSSSVMSQADIDNIQSLLNFKRQQKEEMINHLHQYQSLNRILTEKYQRLIGGVEVEVGGNRRVGEGKKYIEESRENSLKPKSKRKLSLISTSFCK